MAIEICPLAQDIGNLADWAAVAVALLGAVAVFLLGRAANRTANASFELTRRIKQREDELELREMRLLSNELLTDVNLTLAEVQKVAGAMGYVKHGWNGEGGISQIIQRLSLATADRERDRLHILPDVTASDVAEAQLRIRQLRDTAHAFTARHFGGPGMQEFLPVVKGSLLLAQSSLERAHESLRDAIAAAQHKG